MWVLFSPEFATDPLWQTIEENEFFELQAYKPVTSNKPETSLLSMLTALPSTLLAVPRLPSLVAGGTEESFPYRILLKQQPPYGQRFLAKASSREPSKDTMDLVATTEVAGGGPRSSAQVIAIAKDLRMIKEHWNWLVNDMSTACSFFTRESEKEENELWDFLLVKFTSMAQQEAKKREIQREREREKAMERERQIEIACFVDNKHKYLKKQSNVLMNEEEEEDVKSKEKRFEEMDQVRQALWKKLFPKISTIERLIMEFQCSMDRKGVERKGLLLVTPRHVCFHSPRLNTRVAIYWRVITSLSRATAMKGTVPAIFVTCLGSYHEEFLFHSFADFEQAMSVLVRLWHMALLEEIGDRDGDEDAKARLMGITREQLLCDIDREKYRKLFRMPKEETLMSEYCGSLWMENIIQVYEGTLYVSTNYVCFHAEVEENTFSVVIPLREVVDIISVDSKLIQVNTQTNKFSFSLFWRRQNCCELMVQLWSRRIRSTERLLEKVPSAEGPDDPGFVGLGPILEDPKHFRSDYVIKQKLQRMRWEEYIAKYGWGIQMIKLSDALPQIVRYGIPDELKSGLWQIFLGSVHSHSIKPGEYQRILKQFEGKNSEAVSEIERDISRSFPEHPYFQSDKGKEALRNVLTAYSWRNPSLGYCQSMNIICSLLLLFMPEEEAFWALTVLCEDMFSHYFTPDMLGSMTDQHVFEDLVAEHFRKLNAHLESIQLPLVLISFPWFMCLFIGYLPMQTSIRILDILFCEGYDCTFIFKVALAVIKFNQKLIINSKDFSKLVMQLKFTDLDCESLLEITTEFGWVTSKLINEMRDYHRFQLLKESKNPLPPITSPSGGVSPSTRSNSAPTHFPRAPTTPSPTSPTPSPASSSPPMHGSNSGVPIRTRSDSSLSPSYREGLSVSLTTIPFLLSMPQTTTAGGISEQPSSGTSASAPESYTESSKGSLAPPKAQFTGIPFVGSDAAIMSAIKRLSSKERLPPQREADATTAESGEETSSIDESTDEDYGESTGEEPSGESSNESQKRENNEGKVDDRSPGRSQRTRQKDHQEHVFNIEIDNRAPSPTVAVSHAPHDDTETVKTMQDLSTERESGSTDADPTPVRRLSYSKSEPSTPNHLTVKYTTAEGLEKRRSRRSRRRRALPPRSRKSKERAVAHLVERQGNRDSNEPSDELEKRIERLDLDLNLALRREPPHDTNKGVKYLQRFLFKKRRRHSDGYLDIIKEEDILAYSKAKAGEGAGEPSSTNRRFFVEEDEGEERDSHPDRDTETSEWRSTSPGKGKEKTEPSEKRRAQTDGGQRANQPQSQVWQDTTGENESHQQLRERAPSPTLQGSERSNSSSSSKLSATERNESDDESSSYSGSERELKNAIFIASINTRSPSSRKKKVRKRRGSVANLLKKESGGLDHAGAFVERKRVEQQCADENRLSRSLLPQDVDNFAATSDNGGGDRRNDGDKERGPENHHRYNLANDAATAIHLTAHTTEQKSGSVRAHSKASELRSSGDNEDGDDEGDGVSRCGRRTEGGRSVNDELDGSESPEGRRKKIRTKPRLSRRMSLSEPSLRFTNAAANGKGQCENGGDSDADDKEEEEEKEGEEWESTASKSGGSDENSEDGRRGSIGDRTESSNKLRSKFFKYNPVDILSKSKPSSFKERDRKRLEEKRKEDDRRDREEREKRKRDGRDARRRSKEEERRQKDRDHLITADAEKKRRHQEERELKRKKEEERELRKKKEEEERDIKRKKEEEIRRKRKEESKEKKRQQRMEKEQQERERKRASSLKEKQSPRYERTENNDAKEKDGKPKKAFGLLPLPHLSHAHSFLPSSPRRTGSSALSAPPQQISPRRGTSPSHNQQPHQPHQQQYQGGAFLPNSEIMHHGIHPSAQSALGMHDNTTIPTTREKES